MTVNFNVNWTKIYLCTNVFTSNLRINSWKFTLNSKP